MMSKRLLALSALLAGTWAQSTTSAPSKAAAASATRTGTAIQTHTVAVGASGHKFTPAEVEAEVGDVIEWKFYPSGHWIIRGDYNYPCIPYEYIGTDRTGFSSGAKDVQAITDDGPRFRVTVNDTEPIFFYCGAPGSCVDYHMMGVVNPSDNQTLEGWLEKAEDVDYQLTPGEPWPTEDGGKSPTGASGPKKTGSDDDDDDSGSSHHNKLSAGAIAGIAIGGAAVVLIGAGLIYLCGRRGGFDKAYRKSFRNSTAPPAYPATPTVETTQYVASPGVVTANLDPAWAAKQPSPMVAYGQQPISPQHTGYTFPQGVGTMMSADGSTLNTLYDPHVGQTMTPPPVTPQPEPIAPVELPASVDPGNSPLPAYSDAQNGQNKKFSWAGEESGSRPPK